MEKTYNGWSNYETWLCNVWLSNDQYTHEEMQRWAGEAVREAEGDREAARDALRKVISDIVFDLLVPEGSPERTAVETGIVADFFNSAWSEIDWRDLAEHYVSDVEYVENEEENTEETE